MIVSKAQEVEFESGISFAHFNEVGTKQFNSIERVIYLYV